jgi:plasmid stabilization system protein ParE
MRTRHSAAALDSSRFPYIIAYQLPDADTVEILAVIHDAREWPKGLDPAR